MTIIRQTAVRWWLLLCLAVLQLQQPVQGNFVPMVQFHSSFDGFRLLSTPLKMEEEAHEQTSIPANSLTVPVSGLEETSMPVAPTTMSSSIAPTIDNIDAQIESFTPSSSVSPPSFSPSESEKQLDAQSPSSLPSISPSTAPTLACRDLADYRSPINGFPCSAHANTNCLAWRFLGLNRTELQTLVDSCPITCGIECGTFQQFASSLDFRLAEVPGFLNEDTKESLEEASFDYLQEYLKAHVTPSPAAAIELETVVLTFQDLAVPVENRRRWLRQPLTPPNDPSSSQARALDIALSVEGFSVDLDSETLERLLADGIASSGYRDALRRSDDFFANAVTLSNDDKASWSPTPLIEDGASDSSRAVIFVSFAVPIVLAGFGIVAAAYHRFRTGSWIPFRHQQRPPVGDGVTISPEREICPNMSDKNGSITSGSPRESVVSDDDATLAEGGRVVGSTLRRFFASLSLSWSRNSTEQEEEALPDTRFEAGNIPVIDGPVASKVHYGLDDDGLDDNKNPFPPMIVIDNIDANENLEAPTFDVEEKNQSVSCGKNKALDDFATEFREAIKTTEDKSRSMVFPDAFKSFFQTMTDNENTKSNNHNLALQARSSLDMLFGSESSDEESAGEDEDDRSTASTPVKSARPIIDRPLRRTSSFNTFGDIDRQILPVVEQENEEDVSTKSIQDSSPQVAASSDIPSYLLPMSPATPPEVIEKGRARGLPPIRRFHTPDRWRRDRRLQKQPALQHHHAPSDKDSQKQPSKVHSLFSFSPTTKMMLDTPGTAKRPALSRMGSSFSTKSGSGHHRRTSSSSSSGHHRRTSSSSISTDGIRASNADHRSHTTVPNSVRMDFVAPRHGQLGLVLGESSSRSGTQVVTVKDYSPLFGMIMKGDRMLEIDGKNVSRASLAEVTKLLTVSSKPLPFAYSRGGHSVGPQHTLRIAVLRRIPRTLPLAGTDHKRHGSHGSASSGSVLDSAMID